jgi:hypothetical protein
LSATLIGLVMALAAASAPGQDGPATIPAETKVAAGDLTAVYIAVLVIVMAAVAALFYYTRIVKKRGSQ